MGIEVTRSKKEIFISQQKYIRDLLKEIVIVRCKPTNILMKSNHKLGEKNEEPMVDRGIYQRIVRKLIYLLHTRRDITYVVIVVSQFMHSSLKSHMDVVYKIIGYLKTGLGKGIMFQKNNDFKLEVYTGVD